MRRLLILIAPLLLSACASTSGGGSMLVETTYRGNVLPGAHCVLSSGATSWTVQTPASVYLGDLRGDLHVLCDKPGYRNSELIVRSGGALLGPNVALGVAGGSGHGGIGLGMRFPLILGSAGYPGRIAVEMTPQ